MIPKALRRILALSLAVHVLVIAAIALVASSTTKARVTIGERSITAKLVRLGKERPENWLPRKSEPPPPAPVPAPGKKPLAKEASAKAPAPSLSAPSVTDRVKQLQELKDAMQRLKRKPEEPEGHKDGVLDGEATTLDEAIAGNRFDTEIHRCLRQSYYIEGIEQRLLLDRQVLLLMKIRADGTFFDIGIIESSGLARFDQAVLQAVEKCGKVSAPPPSLQREVAEEGRQVLFTAE